jgi:hypothetical protein
MRPANTPTHVKPREAGTYWQYGRVVDGEPPPSSPWARIVGVLVMVMVFDLLARVHQVAAPSHTPDRRDALLAILDSAAADDRRPVLLIGDSVLAGDVMAGHVEDWEHQRVVDHMQAELAPAIAGQPGTSLGVHQIALDGLLPVDVEHIVAELDRVDPQGRVELVLELNLRYFSASYAEQHECSREFLCGLAPHVGAGSRRGPLARFWSNLVADARFVDDRLHHYAPIHGRSVGVGERLRLDRVEGLAVDRVQGAREQTDHTQMEGEARVLEHYRSASVSETNAQVQALRRTLARLHGRGRRAVIFVTPLEDQFAGEAAPEPELGGLHSQLGALVHEFADPRLRFVDLDHPLFVADLFIDHCHLWPEGNRLLALNLLHELSARLQRRPTEASMVIPEDFDQTLVARVDVGFSEGAAWQALFDNPDGIDVSPDGRWIVVADTNNHVLRQLRGHMRVVETLAGQPLRRGANDGRALGDARLDRPRHPTLVGDAVVFIDGQERDRLRVADTAVDQVLTLNWAGPRCGAYRRLRARDGWLYMLCDDGRILSLELGAEVEPVGEAHELLGRPGNEAERAHRFEVAPEGRLFFSDPQQRIWEAEILGDGTGLTGRPWLAFANTSKVLLPSELGVTFPFGFDGLGLADISDLRWVERYGGLLIADEHPLNPSKPNPKLERKLTERVHLRFFDFEAERIYPWVKPVPHGEAYALWNERSRSVVSYYHQGSYALVASDASLVWIERSRSRLFRINDGLLGLIKVGNRNSRNARVELYDTIANVAPDEALAAYSPFRFFDTRFDPFERDGPYVGVMVGSSLTALVDRVGNYSLGRRLELELQRELGYRDNIRFDLFQRTSPSASLKNEIGMVDKLASAGVALDVIFVEIHDHDERFFRGIDNASELFAQLSRLETIAAETDALVVLFDNSAMDATGRDGLRPSTAKVHELLDAARKLGFVVLEPSDRMLRDLLVESPWSTQPWGKEAHHGASYAIDRTAEVMAALIHPALRAHLVGRTPARLRARTELKRGKRLVSAFEGVEFDRAALPEVRPAYIQQDYAAGHVRLFVDLSGFTAELLAAPDGLDRVAAAVLIATLEHEAFGQLADQVTVTLVEFDNYDEYGEGVLESASRKWEETLDAEQLATFLRDVTASQ